MESRTSANDRTQSEMTMTIEATATMLEDDVKTANGVDDVVEGEFRAPRKEVMTVGEAASEYFEERERQAPKNELKLAQQRVKNAENPKAAQQRVDNLKRALQQVQDARARVKDAGLMQQGAANPEAAKQKLTAAEQGLQNAQQQVEDLKLALRQVKNAETRVEDAGLMQQGAANPETAKRKLTAAEQDLKGAQQQVEDAETQAKGAADPKAAKQKVTAAKQGLKVARQQVKDAKTRVKGAEDAKAAEQESAAAKQGIEDALRRANDALQQSKDTEDLKAAEQELKLKLKAAEQGLKDAQQQVKDAETRVKGAESPKSAELESTEAELEQMAAEQELKKAAPPFSEGARSAVTKFVTHFTPRLPIADLTPRGLEAFQETIGPNAADAAERLIPVKEFLSFCWKTRGYTETNLGNHLRVKTAAASASARIEHEEAERFEMTADGLQQLKEDLERHKEELPAAIQAVAQAREDKDIRENAPLEAARENQERLNSRINELEYQIAHAVISAGGTAGRAHLGSTVSVRRLDAGGDQVQEYTLVGPTEVNAEQRRISVESPVGKGLVDATVGAIVEIEVQRGTMRYEVVSVEG